MFADQQLHFSWSISTWRSVVTPAKHGSELILLCHSFKMFLIMSQITPVCRSPRHSYRWRWQPCKGCHLLRSGAAHLQACGRTSMTQHWERFDVQASNSRTRGWITVDFDWTAFPSLGAEPQHLSANTGSCLNLDKTWVGAAHRKHLDKQRSRGSTV